MFVHFILVSQETLRFVERTPKTAANAQGLAEMKPKMSKYLAIPRSYLGTI